MRRWYDENLQAKKEYDREYRKRRKEEARQSLSDTDHLVEDEG
jgi:hypothetical protein